jgi:hypothetical protein
MGAAIAVAVVGCASGRDGSEDGPPGDDAGDDAGDDTVDAPPDQPDAMPDACVASTELCNTLDDDCDAEIDEDFPTVGDLCSAGTGACVTAGSIVCSAIGGTECNAIPGGGGAELCNTIDDDCDEAVDEDFAVGAGCDGSDGDVCVEGTIMCDGAGAAVCTDGTGTTTELCNSADDDCDAATDEGFPVGATCTAGTGACMATGQRICTGDGTGTACNAVAGTPTAETCGDGLDQDCTGADVTCPVNDLAAGAIDISAGGVFTIDLVAAHDDDVNATLGCGSTGGRDVFYQFSLAAPEVVYANTFGSSFDTVVRIYNGTCVARTGTPTCDDDAGACAGLQSQLATQLAAGTYCLVVDQYSNLQTTGALILTFVRGGRAGTALAIGSGLTVSGTTAGGTNTTGSTSCQSNASGPEAAYFFTFCPESGAPSVAANTCNASTAFDTVIALRKGSVTSGDLGCDDDACASPTLSSVLPATATTGVGLYWLLVDGYNGGSGAYQLSYTIN